MILAGGNGTRLKPLTSVTNKHLLPIGEKPMLQHCVEKLVEAGITDIMVVTGGDHFGAIAEVELTVKANWLSVPALQCATCASELAGSEQEQSLNRVQSSRPLVTDVTDVLTIHGEASVTQIDFPWFALCCVLMVSGRLTFCRMVFTRAPVRLLLDYPVR